MNKFQLITATLLFATLTGFSQQEWQATKQVRKYNITIEPGLGISPMPIMDMNLSNIVQVGFSKRFSAMSYSSIRQNNFFLRDFNNIHSSNNFTFSQKVGIGVSLYTRRSSHTMSFLAGVKYDTYRETLDNPAFDKVDVKISATSPDFAFMYNLKIGQKKYFFSYRMCIPLYPYPVRTPDINAIDGNLANVSLEIGLGIRL